LGLHNHLSGGGGGGVIQRVKGELNPEEVKPAAVVRHIS
jgi:hypothetical protein